MELYSTTSDVKWLGEDKDSSLCAGFTSNVLPKVKMSNKALDLQIGVSTRNAQLGNILESKRNVKDIPHWYALRTTYGREKKAYDYLVGKNVVAFYPTLRKVKFVEGKRVVVEESRIHNLFFAYGTEEELKAFVYDNINLPFLRFYYRHTHINKKIVKEPLIVPDEQIESLKIVCATDSDDIVISIEEIEKFKKGQKVRITDGKFKGVVGVVARYHSQQRVGIVIDGLLTICTAYIPSAFLETINNKL